MKNVYFILVPIIVGIILGIYVTSNLVSDTINDQSLLTNTQLMKNGSPEMGLANAPISIVEFGDYQCTFCYKFHQNTLNDIKTEYIDTGKANYVYRDFPLNGASSILAAEATYCANEQGKYWEYHNILYNNWAGENNGWASKQNLVKFANDIELDLKSFSQCMDSNDYNDMINQSNNDARELGISGTPAFFIVDQKNGQVLTISGAQPYEVFERVFNSIIEK